LAEEQCCQELADHAAVSTESTLTDERRCREAVECAIAAGEAIAAWAAAKEELRVEQEAQAAAAAQAAALAAAAAAAIVSSFMNKSVCACICVSACTGRQPSAFRAHCAPKSQGQLEIQQDSHDVCTQNVPVLTSTYQYVPAHAGPYTAIYAMYCHVL
jgi:nucleoid-associated protein YgaU